MVTVKTLNEREETYEDLLVQYLYLMKEILNLSEEIILPREEDYILRKGQRLMLEMIKMYLLLLTMVMDYPTRPEMKRIRESYRDNSYGFKKSLLKEIRYLRIEYLQGLKARHRKTDPSKIVERYFSLARKNLYHYQEMRESLS